MKNRLLLNLALQAFAIACLGLTSHAAIALTNPVVFVTQPPIARELNSSVSNTFLSVVTLFGNHLPDTAHAARGGDLWLMTTNTSLVNLTRKAGFGTNGIQAGVGIAVRDPVIHWGGKRVLFSMVVGAPTNATDASTYNWQLYELTNLDSVIANTNTVPVIVKVANQPTNYNNVTPCYGSDGRIIFMTDQPFKNQAWLYPQRDEYKGAPSVTGTYSLDPATGDLRILDHLPSGAFNPIVDSFGRLIVTRWDHLIQDPNASNDRLGKATNGSINFLAESFNPPTQSTNLLETFPEPDDFDTNYASALGVTPNGFNLFLPWTVDQAGGNEEVINHVGRHELVAGVTKSFTADNNLLTVTNYTNRGTNGIVSANTNYLNGLFHLVEDPRTNGLYWGIDCQDISIFGGTHSSGQIITLLGPPSLNPTGMVVNYITPKNGSTGPTSLGLFRNPLPMSDGQLLAVFSSTPTGVNFGFDTNTGTASLPTSQYHFRLMTLVNGGTTWTTNQFLTIGLTNVAIYWDGATLVTNNGPLWELQPVEVRARAVPTTTNSTISPIEQQVFTDEGVDLTTFKADMINRGVALVVSRNVTARDAADKQQPYNLSIPGGAQTLGTNGAIYNITHLQYLQADYLRGYTAGATTNQPGRRILATPMHDTAALNPPSSRTNAPLGGTELMSDGSQATIVPAGRAVTWQLTGVTNESIVKERYWINFRAGEIRTCANCHGINAVDQAGRPSPTNAPLALRQLLRYWKTNSASSYTLSVNNGNGSGNYGAGSIVTLTAGTAPYGKYFTGWSGAGVSNAVATTTTFIMPTNNASVTAVFTPLPTPNITAQTAGTNITFNIATVSNQTWVLQTTTNLTANWSDLSTNTANGTGLLQFHPAINRSILMQYFRLRAP